MAILDTKEGIEFYRLATLKAALGLEVAGLRRSRGPSAYTLLKRMGYRGSKGAVLAKVQADVNATLYQRHVDAVLGE